MAASRIKSIDHFYDFIGYVVLCAPNNFPHRDYHRAEEQMDLERAFSEIKESILLVEADFPGADLDRGLSQLLERSLDSYKQGDEVAGAHLLQDFQDLIFTP